MLNKIKNKAQEEMVGFALIIIIVSVILLIFLGFSINHSKSDDVENYEVNSFIQAVLSYTTDCAQGYEPAYKSIKKLIISCNRQEKCLDQRDSCEVLNSTLSDIIKESWIVGEDNPVKGYDLKINTENNLILELNQGNITNNYKSSSQDLGLDKIHLSLDVYYGGALQTIPEENNEEGLSTTNTGSSTNQESSNTGNGNSESQTTNTGGDYSSLTVSNEGDDFESLYKYIKPPIKGFKDLYNPNTIQGYEDSHNPGHKLMYVSINIVNGPRLGAANPGSASVQAFPAKFKLFIPPGTSAIYGVTIYYPINVKEGIIIRYQQVPDAQFMSYAGDPDGWKYMSWDSEDSTYLNTAKTRDMYTRNGGGHAKALTGQAAISISVKDSGWLYLQKIPFSSDTIDTVSALIQVDYDAYKEWYNKVKPCTEPNQDSSAGYCWDEEGNPKELIYSQSQNNFNHAQVNSEGNDYFPMYNYEIDMHYCSKQTCPGQSSCSSQDESSYPCGQKQGYENYPYRHELSKKSFKEIYNLNDKRILCGIDYEDDLTCNSIDIRKDLSFTTMAEHAISSNLISGFPDSMRIFIPPGTKEFTITTYFRNMVKEFLFLRYKKAPDGEYFDWKGNIQYEDVPGSLEGSVSLDEMKQRDFFFANRQGHIFPLSFYKTTPMTSDEAGWLYIGRLFSGSRTMMDMHVSLKLNVEEYLNWYNNVKELNSDGTCSAEWCWDEDGNPKELI